jgi:hypothetical protein
MKDAVGKSIPSWARYIKEIAIAGALAEQKDGGQLTVPFALYCPAEAVVTLTPIDNTSALTAMTLTAGYHPIACKSVTTTDIKIYALFAYKYE